MKPKYDRSVLKWMFFKSDIIDVKSFFENIWHSYNRHITINTKWRQQEKKRRTAELQTKAIETAEEEYIKKYKPNTKQLEKFHELIMLTIWKKILSLTSKDKDADDIYTKDIETLWKMVKTEKWEPTSISKDEWAWKSEPITIILNWPKKENNK